MIEYNKGWDWQSHESVIKFFTEVYDIEYIVEQGTGLHSTPILKRGCKSYYGFEEDGEFRRKMIDEGVYDMEDVIHLPLPDGVTIFTKYNELTDEQKQQIETDYIDIRYSVLEGFGDDGYRLLFIDGFSCSRNVCLNMLYDKFDFIIIHDTEPNDANQYEYEFSDSLKETYNYYQVTTPVPYTGILVKKGIDIDLNLLREYMNDYCDTLGWDFDQMQILTGYEV